MFRSMPSTQCRGKFFARSASAPSFPYIARPLPPAERSLKIQLKAASQLMSFNHVTKTLEVAPYILESDPGPITCVASVILQAGNLAHLASLCLDPGLTRDLPASGAARMAEVAGTARISRVYPGGIQGSPALGISNINNDDINYMLQLVGMDLLLGESPDVKPELRQKLLPSEDEVTNTILKLLDSSSPGPLGSQIKLEDVISISSDEDSEQADNKPNMMIDLTADEPVMYRIWDHGVIDLTDD
ncbi:hypothetical protein FOMPIDRAFT_1019257 [Fomitopsis schrenkii]|uniref:Uncharacterized protein n=1 Tax=Fomitopsis schrenkii TaxID=2126942 RepID=S8DX68_FOMSC|nr:hypothetical protein FOMPIDRAFT_1019257 [Fomitopsis schrenkii]